MGEVFELKTQALQFVLICFCRFFSVRQQRLENFSVLQQRIIDISYKIAVTALCFLLVIVIIPAVIITEFFINPAF